MFENSVPMFVGPLYVVIGTLAVFSLLRKKSLTRRMRIVILSVSVLLGFTAFTPMFPVQLQGLILGESPDGKPVGLVLLVLFALVVSTAFTGRIFCGYLCPIGALQELLYRNRLKSAAAPHCSKTFTLIRWGSVLLVVITAVASGISLLHWLGMGAFFRLDLYSVSFYVFAAVGALAIFVYRPFCRIACPLGGVLSLAARFSRLRIQVSDECVSCGQCEKACPTGTAITTGGGSGECYLCLRCAIRCRKGAVRYGK